MCEFWEVQADALTPPDSGPGLPRFVERELRRYLECGLLAHGFARVHRSLCLRDKLVALSCKGRAVLVPQRAPAPASSLLRALGALGGRD